MPFAKEEAEGRERKHGPKEHATLAECPGSLVRRVVRHAARRPTAVRAHVRAVPAVVAPDVDARGGKMTAGLKVRLKAEPADCQTEHGRSEGDKNTESE